MGMRVHVLNVCAARHSASLGAFVFHGSRRELFATVVTFLFLASFCLLCHISYLVGCVQKFCWWILVLDSLHLQRLFTMSCGCWLGSTSFSGGHQVDG